MAESKKSAAHAKMVAAKARAAEKAQMAKSKAKSVSPKKQAGGFIDFIRNQGVVGLAVGLAIGTAAGATVKSLVEGFINPIVQFIVGSQDKLGTNVWHVELWGRTADFAWGAAVSSVITLLATALVIYWLVNVFKLDKLDKKKD